MTDPAGEPRDTIGMTAEELLAYLEALLTEEAAEAAARAAASYAVKLIDANNAYIARYLLDRGILPGGED